MKTGIHFDFVFIIYLDFDAWFLEFSSIDFFGTWSLIFVFLNQKCQRYENPYTYSSCKKQLG